MDPPVGPTPSEPQPPPIGLMALFGLFLGFGVRAFGGPVAQIAMIRAELVERRQWLSGARFNRLLAVMQALPGPEAHELCVHLGMRARGRLGGLLAGLGFMLPGLVLMLGLSWAYFRLDLADPRIAGALVGLQAAVLALIGRAVVQIGRHALTDASLVILAGAGLIAGLLGGNVWVVLAMGAVGNAVARAVSPALVWAVIAVAAVALVLIGPVAPPQILAQVADATAPGQASAGLLFLLGLKAGLLTFGGAYTAIPFVRTDAVGRGWLSEAQFLDGVALAGVIPAPLIVFTTFVGFLAGGLPGALAMTAGVFAPAFAFSLVFYDRLEAVVDDQRLRALLEGLTAAVVGLIAATALQMASNALAGGSALAVALIGLGSLGLLLVLRGGWAVPAVLLLAALAGLLMRA